MRTREVREGLTVKVRSYATGLAEPFRNHVGKVLSADGSSSPYVDFGPQGKTFIEARWLVATNEPFVAGAPESSELAQFKAKVAQVAQKYAREHGLCEVVDDALKELGIQPRPRGKIRIVFEISEEEFDAYVDQGDDVMEDIVSHFYEVFSAAVPRRRTEWLVSAVYTDEEDK